MRSVSEVLKNGARELFFGSADKRFRSEGGTMLRDYLLEDAVQGVTGKCVTSVYASNPLDCKVVDGAMREKLRNSFNQFRYMPVVNIPASMTSEDGPASHVGGSLVVLGASYGLVLQIQRGPKQVAVVIPLNVKGMSEYIEQCLRSDVMPLAGWCESESMDGVIALPPMLRNCESLLKDLKGALRHDERMLEHVSQVATALCLGDAKSLVDGVELERLMVTCVVPAKY